MVTSLNVARSRTGSVASGRPSITARCSPVLVKMPRRAPSRTRTLLVCCACISVATPTIEVAPSTSCARRRNACATRDIVSACISRWLWRWASAPSLFDRSENSNAPKVALLEISEWTASFASW